MADSNTDIAEKAERTQKTVRSEALSLTFSRWLTENVITPRMSDFPSTGPK